MLWVALPHILISPLSLSLAPAPPTESSLLRRHLPPSDLSLTTRNGPCRFRDYGLFDMAQLKMAEPKGHKISDNFYVRKDGTRAYYFAEDEVPAWSERSCRALLRAAIPFRLHPVSHSTVMGWDMTGRSGWGLGGDVTDPPGGGRAVGRSGACSSRRGSRRHSLKCTSAWCATSLPSLLLVLGRAGTEAAGTTKGRDWYCAASRY